MDEAMKVTERMMRAGAKAIQDSGIAEGDYPRIPSSSDRLVARDIFLAMYAAALQERAKEA